MPDTLGVIKNKTEITSFDFIFQALKLHLIMIVHLKRTGWWCTSLAFDCAMVRSQITVQPQEGHSASGALYPHLSSRMHKFYSQSRQNINGEYS